MSAAPAYKIAVYPGDGIGIDVIHAALPLLTDAASAYGVKLDLHEFNWGRRYWLETGKQRTYPVDYLDQLRPFDAIFLGALGDPANVPDHITTVPLLQMRQVFDQYVCLRPAKLLAGATSPLAGQRPGDIDMLVLRENSEGEYLPMGGVFKPGTPEESALQTAIHTRHGIERILRYGFTLARQRRRQLTMATKSNVLIYGMVLWDKILAELAPQYPDVKVEKVHIDALSMNFVRWPQRYDVVVASNLFGDILSDIAGVIVGSIGLAPSANINPEKTAPSLFEPVHGSAPDIAGQGLANPIAAIRAGAMMLDFLGAPAAAAAIETAVTTTLVRAKVGTKDLGGTASTQQLTDEVRRELGVVLSAKK